MASFFIRNFFIGVLVFVYSNLVLAQMNGRNSNVDSCLIVPSCTHFVRSRFRSIDGSCNNLQWPWLGATNRPYRKLMTAEYTRFGSFDLPRGGKSPSMLPPARTIRLEVHPDVNQPDERLSTVMMSFGQFTSHTMISTRAQQLTEPVNTCCVSTTKTDSCFPIQLPSDETFFAQFNIGCRNFKRSPPYCPANQQQQRQQTNQLSSFLDLSTVYGSDISTVNRLRLFSGGLMKMGSASAESLLPDLVGNQAAFDAGDSRVNQNPMLTAMHTVWLREHNRIATQLSSVHLEWNDERLYQETRRIVIAEFQNIVYNEYLRLLINPQTYSQWHLNSTWYSTYGPNIDPSIAAEVSGAALRMGHSMVNGNQALMSNGIHIQAYDISDYYFRPKDLLKTNTDLNHILEGMATVPNQKVDRFVTDALANRFGKTRDESFGSDLISTNIQRGRDHGIPSYNSVRRYCRLAPLSFAMSTVPAGIYAGAWAALKRAYRTADDIDLFSGGLSELPYISSVLGPTFTCILVQEFYHRKYSDRYFFTHARVSGSFTPVQLQNIVQRRLFDIFCDNTQIQWLAPSVFQLPIGNNAPVACSSSGTRRRLNLNLF